MLIRNLINSIHTIKLVRFYEGADGLKTGHTDDAGYCLAATAKRNGLRLIGVVLGSSTGKIRNTETMNLLDYGFNTVKINKLKEKNSVVKKIKLDKASVNNIDIILADDLVVVEEINGNDHKYSYDIRLDDIKLPLKIGDSIGKISILENNKVLSSVNLTVNKNIEKLSYFDLLINSLLDIFSGEI